MSKYRVTVVSAYHGNREMTQEFMERLAETLSPKDRVVLVNAENEPNKGEIVWTYPTHWEYVTIHKNVGFANSMNAGIKKALEEDTEYICILGNDGFPYSMLWLDQLIETQKTYSATITCPEPDNPHISVYDRLKLGRVNNHVNEYIMFPAICWLIPTKVVKEIGLFDETFEGGCWEDNDYVRRIRNSGGHIVVDHRVKLHHLLSQTFGKLPNYVEISTINGRKYCAKWGLPTPD